MGNANVAGSKVTKNSIKKISKSNNKDSKFSAIEDFLYKAYRKIRIRFEENDIISYKMRLCDCENYFYTQFNHLLIFNNELFYYNVNKLYDNYNTSIENFMKEKSESNELKIFKVLVILLDETDVIVEQKTKIEFDSLFTIIFEKIELNLALYLDFTGVQFIYARAFFEQLSESTYLYKCNRKFDCLYSLLPNLDYLFKNLNTLLYFTSRSNMNINDCNQVIDALLNVKHFNKFLSSTYTFIEANDIYKRFIENNKPLISISLYYICFNQYLESDFYTANEYHLKLMENLIKYSVNNVFLIYLYDNFEYNENFNEFIKLILSYINSKEHDKFFLKIKFLYTNCINQVSGVSTNNKNEFMCTKIFETIDKIVIKFFEEIDEDKLKKLNFIVEFYEACGDKYCKMKFNYMYFRINTTKNELIANSLIKERSKISDEMEYAAKIIQVLYPKVYKNKKIIRLIHDFVDEKKLNITNKQILDKKSFKDKNILFEKGQINGFSYKKEFKKNFLINN